VSDEVHEMGQRIADSRKSYRYVARARCPRDTRVVAATLFAEGDEWVWVAGGRTGSHADMVAEFERNRDDALHDAQRARAHGNADLERVALDTAREFVELLGEVIENRYPRRITANGLADRRRVHMAMVDGRSVSRVPPKLSRDTRRVGCVVTPLALCVDFSAQRNRLA
jgi:hypothetical protein